jgi:methyl-accepting chemotaxis protein
MSPTRLLHPHPRHRARQLRWVVPLFALLLAATLAMLAVQYHVSNQAVGTEFFRAHKTISHTGELLRRGTLVGALVVIVLVVLVAGWALRVTHRIVRPVHTLHRALDALAAGDLGVRVVLHEKDEFREVADALNRVVDELATVLARVRPLLDRVAAAVSAVPEPRASELRALVAELERAVGFFRAGPPHPIGEDDD